MCGIGWNSLTSLVKLYFMLYFETAAIGYLLGIEM